MLTQSAPPQRDTVPASTVADEAARKGADMAPRLSLIVAVDWIDAGSRRSLEEMVAAVSELPIEVIAATMEPWKDSPAGVRVIADNSVSRGNRFDKAAEQSQGDILAFTDSRTRLTRSWADRLLSVFNDPEVAMAGGPVLPRSWSRGERVGAALIDGHLGMLPNSHVNRVEPARNVGELTGSNLAIRKEAFWSVGGFQSPAAGGEALRLSYKVRALLGKQIRYDPALAVSATALGFPRQFLSNVAQYGRTRGDLARRLPGVAPLIPYGLPVIAALVLAAELALIIARQWMLASIVGGLITGGYSMEAVLIVCTKGRLGDRLLALTVLPLVPLVYAFGFTRGFVGRNLSDISPAIEQQRPLRVLILNWRDVTHHYAGGAETYMHEIARQWVQQGFDVGWLCQRSRGRSSFETIDGVRIHRIGGRLTVYPRVALSYLTTLRKRYDVIVDCENGIPFFTPFFSRLPKVLLVHHVHREIFRQYTKPPIRWLGYWLEGWLMPRVYRNSAVVAVSKSTEEDLVSMGFKRAQISIVRNGMLPPEAPIGEKTSTPTILYLGRLTAQKSVDVLIRAMPSVLKQIADARLDIVGQGPERATLERLTWSLGLAQHVRFHGYATNGAREAHYARAWVAVCPSRFEGWGVAALEASARGLPVIAADVPGLRDSVRDGETGLLVPHGDPAALAQKLLELLLDAARRAELGAAGRAWAAEHSWEESAAMMNEILLNRRAAKQARVNASWLAVELVGSHKES